MTDTKLPTDEQLAQWREQGRLGCSFSGLMMQDVIDAYEAGRHRAAYRTAG